MWCRFKLWGLLAAAFSVGILVGIIFPAGFLVVVECLLIIFIVFCWMCG